MEQEKFFAIVCNGKTEIHYFEQMKKAGKIPKHYTILEQTKKSPFRAYEKISNLEKYTQIYMVYDLEVDPARKTNNFQKDHEKLLKKNVICCESKPSFEFWILLHFENSTAVHFTTQKVEEKLKKNWENYQKGNKNNWEIIQDKHAIALTRAEKSCQDQNTAYTKIPQVFLA